MVVVVAVATGISETEKGTMEQSSNILAVPLRVACRKISNRIITIIMEEQSVRCSSTIR